MITSKDNEIVKKIRKLKEKKYRDEENVYVIEGIKVIEEAINENVNIKKKKGLNPSIINSVCASTTNDDK